MKKLNKKHVLIFSVCVIAILCLIAFQFRKFLELKGNKEETIALNSEYIDAGTNITDAQKTGEVNTKLAGVYTITYQYHNQEVSRTVKVVDQHQLVINLNGSSETYVKQGDPYIESGCHAIDKKEGNLTSQIKHEGEVDTSKAGDYSISYSVQNKEGLTCLKERTVHVVEPKDFLGNDSGIPVLMYHYVYTKDDIPEKLNVNYIKDTDLEAQLQYLQQQKYYFPSYQELQAYIQGKISLPKKSVVLTFDDGQAGFLKYGIPLLEKYKIPATSFIIASKGEKKIKNYANEYVSFQSHSYDMHKAGGNIGHGGIISALSQNQILDDLKKAQTIVQNSEAFAYPYGDVTDSAKQAVTDAQILCAFTTQYGKVKKGMNLTTLPRVRVTGTNSLKAYIASIS